MSEQKVGSGMRIEGKLTLSPQELKLVKKSIEISKKLDPDGDLYKLNQQRFVFCIEYFFSIFKETRKITTKEKFGVFELNYISATDVILFFDSYKKEIHELDQRLNIQIKPESIADSLSKEAILTIQSLWRDSCINGIEAIPNNDVHLLVDKALLTFKIDRNNQDVKNVIEKWQSQLSYYLIFEEYSLLFIQLSGEVELKAPRNTKIACAACLIF